MGGKKTENTKKIAGNAQKAEVAAQKNAAAQAAREREEAAEWSKGAKNDAKKKAAEDKKAEQAAKKEEARLLLAQEEASQRAKPKGENKKTAEKKTRGLDLNQLDDNDNNTKLSDLNASGLDNALDALSLTGSTNDVKIDRHPERRKEAAYQAYAAWREEELKGSGLRRDQRIKQMRKEFEKRPENPFNQATGIRYDATKEEIAEHKQSIATATENRLTGTNPASDD